MLFFMTSPPQFIGDKSAALKSLVKEETMLPTPQYFGVTNWLSSFQGKGLPGWCVFCL